MVWNPVSNVKETSATTGVGTYSLAGAISGFRSFSVAGTGNLVPYRAQDASGNFEEGIGLVTVGSPNTLARTYIYNSSNAGAAVSWSSTVTLACVAIPSMFNADYWMRLASAYTLTSTTSLQKLFNGTTNGALTLAAGKYWFDLNFGLSGMSSTTGNGQLDILGAGTAALANIRYHHSAIDNATPASIAAQSHGFAIAKATPALIATTGTATAMAARATGWFDVTTAGTFIPSFALTTAAAAIVAAGSSILVKKIGESGEDFRGPWS